MSRLFVSFCLWLCAGASAASDFNASLTRLAGNAGWPEAAVVRVQSERAPEFFYYGAAHGERRYLLGSVSKTLTALLCLRLVAAERLQLDQAVTVYLPALRFARPHARAPTIRELLQHRSGIDTATGLSTWPAQPAQWPTINLSDAPNSAYHYSNANYWLLGAVIEAISGRSFEQVLRSELLQPLAMPDTGVVLSDQGLAPAHQYWFGLALPVTRTAMPSYSAAAGFIATTPNDIAHLLDAVLRQDPQLLPPELWQQMLKVNTNLPGYGLGIQIYPWGDGVSYAHDGLLSSDAASVQWWPKDGVAVAVLTPINEGIFAPTRDAVLSAAWRDHQHKSALSVWPWERLLRLLLGGITLAMLFIVWRQWHLWQRAGRPSLPARWRGRAIVLLRCLPHLLLPIALIHYFAMPWQTIYFQPDLATALLLGAIGGVLASYFKASRNAATR